MILAVLTFTDLLFVGLWFFVFVLWLWGGPDDTAGRAVVTHRKIKA